MSSNGATHSNTTNHSASSSTSTLEDTQYEPILDSDGGTPSPSEDDLYSDLPEQAIRVSIGRTQTRLASPKTPAAEKAAAMEERGGFFNDRWDLNSLPGANQRDRGASGTTPDFRTLSQSAITAEPDSDRKSPLQNGSKINGSTSPPSDLPSPWVAGPKFFQHSEDSARILRQGFTVGRQRASSGPEESRMRFPFNLPSLPNPFGSDGPNDQLSSEKDLKVNNFRNQQNLRNIPQTDGVPWSRESWSELVARVKRAPLHPRDDDSDASLSPNEKEGVPIKRRESQNRIQQVPQQSQRIKRTISDDSLLLHRTLSRASSLGDDSRFENVSEQINSRFKAFKDSLQDANFRLSLPMPPSIFTSSSRDGIFQGGNTPRSSTFNIRRSLLPQFLDSSSQQDLSSSPEQKHSATFQTQPTKPSAGMNAANAAAHPYLSQALEDLEGDLVILGGYRGSILREAQSPHRRLWVPIKVGLNIRKVDLEVGLEPEDEEQMPEKIISTGMLTHIGPVDMSKRLFKRLRACGNSQTGKLRVHDFGYDWRLSPHRLSKELSKFLEGLSCNAPGTPPERRGAIVIAHSLGGLITRHVMNHRPDLFSGVLFAGVPHEGCVNVLGPIRNGDDVLLSSRVLTAQVNFSIRTSFALLPLDGRCFIDKVTKEEYPVDFFDPKQWIEYRWSPCVAPPLPPLRTQAPGRLNSLISSVTDAIPDSVMEALPFTNKRNSQQFRSGQEVKDAMKDHAISAAQSVQSTSHAEGGKPSGITPQMGGNQQSNPAEYNESTQTNVATHCTIPRDKALKYLVRTLQEVKAFKQELAFNPSHSTKNIYPPMSVIYGKSDPTVYGARVHGRDGIKRADAYDDLAFASGDGVVLARAAMLPPGFRAVRGGVVASERGHVTLLGDLEAVGRCLSALIAARKAGIGMKCVDVRIDV